MFTHKSRPTTKHILKAETNKLLRAFRHPTFIYLTILGNSVLLLVTITVYFLEKDVNPNMTTFFDYLWWGVSTTTTIGYGDILPITVTGRIFAMLLMYTGAVLFVTFTGVILTILMKEEVSKELDPLEREFKANEKEKIEIQHALVQIMLRLDQIEKSIEKNKS